MMKQVLICLSLFLAIGVETVFAQKKAKIEFEEMVHDFGSFSIDMKEVSCKFKFTNIGKAPLVIVRVSASCGCTTPSYTEEPVEPGASGEITVTYRADQAGAFQKSVTVYSSADPSRTTLVIRGTVMESQESRDASYPYQMGDLLLKSTHVPFYDMSNHQIKTEKIKVANRSEKPLTIYFDNVPSGLLVASLPSVIPAQGEGDIVITCKPALMKDWGLRQDHFYVKFGKNDKVDPENRITASVDIREDFGELTNDELAYAPAVSLSNKMFDFDRISGRKNITKSITVTNTGKKPLIIRKLDPVANFLKAEISKRTIPAGESAVLSVTLESAKLPEGVLNSRITLISNAPSSPVVNIRVVGTVKN